MAFSEEIIDKVWKKATNNPNVDKNFYRLDEFDDWISRKDYSNRLSTYGWEIGYIVPKSNGGSNEISNLRALQWKNNISKLE